jgi:hypothetical protein
VLLPGGHRRLDRVPVREIVTEYEAKESAEALCARDADKLE